MGRYLLKAGKRRNNGLQTKDRGYFFRLDLKALLISESIWAELQTPRRGSGKGFLERLKAGKGAIELLEFNGRVKGGAEGGRKGGVTSRHW